MGCELLSFWAGNRAYERIRERGLSPGDIRMAVGASGAAKWLSIYGLDRMIFGRWFSGRRDPLYLFGTSIGAWKFAAAAQKDSDLAFDLLKEAYIRQSYAEKPGPGEVTRVSEEILNHFIPGGKVSEILSHPFYRYSLSAVRCRGLCSSSGNLSQLAGMGMAYLKNLVRPGWVNGHYSRTLFHDPRGIPPIARGGNSGFVKVDLTGANFRKAVLASGSIPLVMKGVEGISGAPSGVYRDGGVVDYHPALPFLPDNNGIALYTHFLPRVFPCWFDKKLKSRVAGAERLSNVLLLCPSPAFVKSLPHGRIPDRRDFSLMKGQDRERFRFWETSARKSLRLGEEFMEAAHSGRIKYLVKKIPY